MRRLIYLPLFGSMIGYLLAFRHPEHLPTLALANLFLFSLPHTFSSFTRSDLRKSKAAALALLVFLMLAVGLGLYRAHLDFQLVFVMYFVWQQFHYVRQGEGIANLLQHSPRNQLSPCLYAGVSATTILQVLSRGPQNFFGYSLQWNGPVTLSQEVSAALVLGLTLAFLFTQKRPAWPPFLVHTLLYFAAFGTGSHFFLGWFALNLFHNLQYLSLMVRIEGSMRALLFPLLMTIPVGLILKQDSSVIFLLSLNFTHYLWDSWIWLRRYRPRFALS